MKLESLESKALKKLLALIPNGPTVRNYAGVVRVGKEIVEYTDGFRLLRISNPLSMLLPEGCYSKSEIKRELVVHGAAIPSKVSYPDTEKLMQSCRTEKLGLPRVVPEPDMSINGKFLAECLNVICADSDKKNTRLEITDKFLKISCDENTALIGALQKN